MTQDTDLTPPHGIPRPSRLDAAREWLQWQAEVAPESVAEVLDTFADLLDIAEAFPSLWQAGEADTLESIADQLAELAGARRCPSCEEMQHPDAFGGWATVCDWCREDEPEGSTPSDCDGCGVRKPVYQTTDRKYWLCLRCADQLAEERSRPAFPYREGEGGTPSGWERVKDAPAHPFGGAADR